MYPVKCDVTGKTRFLRLKGSLINPRCEHNLVSLGKLAREEGMATWIGPDDEPMTRPCIMQVL